MALHEIDIATAFLDIPVVNDSVLRITPRVVTVLGDSREAVAAAGYSIIHQIMQRTEQSDGIVWWRIRPRVEDDYEGFSKEQLACAVSPRFRFWARLATSPELPDGFWEPISKKLTPDVLYDRERLKEDPLFGSDLDYQDLHQDYGQIRYIGGRGGSEFGKDPHTADMSKIHLGPDAALPTMTGEQPERPSLADIEAANAALRASLPKITLKKTPRRASRRARRPSKTS